MSRRTNALWGLVSALLGALFLFSLGSDVWEAYLALFVLSVGSHGAVLIYRRSRAR